MFVCIFHTSYTHLAQQYGPQLVLQVHLFPYISHRKHLRRLTVSDAFLVVPSDERCHLISTGFICFPQQRFSKLFCCKSLSVWLFLVIFFVISSFWLLNVMLTMHGGACRVEKKALGNTTIFAQLAPNQTDNSACFKEAMVLQSTASKNQTELKLSVHKAGKCRCIAGFFLVTVGCYGVQVSLLCGGIQNGQTMNAKIFRRF